MSATRVILLQYVAGTLHAEMTSGSATWDELEISPVLPEPAPRTEGCCFTVRDVTGLTTDGGAVEVSIRSVP